MTQRWGRDDAAGTWPQTKPICTLVTVLVAILCGGATAAYRYATAWTPLQRAYLSSYRADAAHGGSRGHDQRPLSPPAGGRSRRRSRGAR